MTKEQNAKYLRELHEMTTEEYQEWSKKIYNKHTKKDDGRCQGYHSSDSSYVPEVYNHVLERDFIDEVCDGM